MKKVVSLISIVSIMFGSVIPISAYGEIINENAIVTQYSVAEYKGHGEYVLCDSGTVNLCNNLDTMSEGDYIGVTPTVDSEIYYIEGNKYLVNAYEDKYLLSEKVVIDSQLYDNNITLFDEYNIPSDIKEGIEKVIDAQKALGNDDLGIELFVPTAMPNDIQIMANEPLGTVYYDYEYNGHVFRMKDYSVKYYNLASGMIEKTGTSALMTAKAFVDFVLSIPGVVSGVAEHVVTAFGLFETAYDLYVSIYGPIVEGSSDDLLYTNLIYDRIAKFTYAPDPIYGDYPNIGCYSHKVWLNRHDTYQYYSATGEGYLAQESIDREFYSPNFREPAPAAIRNGIGSSQIDFPLEVEIHGTTVRLMGE